MDYYLYLLTVKNKNGTLIIIIIIAQPWVKSDALQTRIIHCWRRDALPGVVRRWPWTVSPDVVQVINCSKSQDWKQQSSCNQWLWLTVARWVCRRRPTAGVDVRWMTGQQCSARYGDARPRRHLLTSIAILYCIRCIFPYTSYMDGKHLCNQ